MTTAHGNPRTSSARLPLLAARAAAYALDVLLLFVVLAPAGWLVQRVLHVEPATGRAIWHTLLWNFSLPTWAWFTLRDAGGRRTPGKRWLGLRVTDASGGPVRVPCALLRTAGKLLPWELAHFGAFGLASAPGTFTTAQWCTVLAANVLAVGWFGAAAATGGRRSVHDVLAGTVVRRA